MRLVDWAYDFTCDRPLQGILAAFNATGPWHWEMRNNLHFDDYLSCRPIEGVRLRVHTYPGGLLGGFVGLHDEGFKAVMEIQEKSPATRPQIDEVFQRLLRAIDAAQVTEIEAYD